MKAAPFDYHRPETIEEALELVAAAMLVTEHGVKNLANLLPRDLIVVGGV